MDSIYLKKEECCGCSACYNACPEQAITMMPDEEGFAYPYINQGRCIDCNKCIKVCPMICRGNYKENELSRFYAARHRSQEVLLQSTSGGAFTALSDAIFRQNGIIYGADYDKDFRVVHQRAETEAQRDRMRISKYVQSDIGNAYIQIKTDLEKGRTVLFTGTPCQAAGLRGYIGASTLAKQLYICDLICYSIPSPLIWEEYKRLLERETAGKLVSVQFRSKKDGWSRANSNKGFLFSTDNNSVIQEDNRFYDLYIKEGIITRPSCSQCPFTDVYRASDLTIADYWGIEKYRHELLDSLGVSVILVNTPKGNRLLEHCRQDLDIEERPMEESFNEQKRLREPIQFSKSRRHFWQDFRLFGFQYVVDNLKMY